MSVQLIEQTAALAAYREQITETLAFVPTMGALHDGHLNLVKEAGRHASRIWVSIFVNPKQFNSKEDLDKYPRDVSGDCRKLQNLGVELVFVPTVDQMYPQGFGTFVTPEYPMVDLWEGASRPGHFKGVTTVVMKLFQIVRPHVAVFGLKDFQQWLILRKMVQDLHMPILMVCSPTVREADGLAMSSRNAKLSSPEREKATLIFRSMKTMEQKILQQGMKDLAALKIELHAMLSQEPALQIDYAEFVSPENLEPQTQFQQKVLVMMAVIIGKTRLLDNLIIQKPSH